MRENERQYTPIIMLAGLWAINLLIVAFGWPFLVYKKFQLRGVRDTTYGTPENAPEKLDRRNLAPCQW